MFDALTPCHCEDKGVQAWGSPSGVAKFRVASFGSESDLANRVTGLLVRVP